MKYLIAIIVLLMSFETKNLPKENVYSDGTCIVISRFENGICVGADTRRAFYASDKKGNFTSNKHDTVCKIIKEGNLYFSVSGFGIDTFYKMAAYCIAAEKTIENTGDKFINEFINHRVNFITNLYTKERRDFNYYYQRLNVVQFAFYGFENNIPKLYFSDFELDTSKAPNFSFKKTVSKQFEKITHSEFAFLGRGKEIKDLHKDEKFMKNKSIQVAIEEMVAIECDVSPTTVSRPIQVLGIFDENNYKWFKSAGKCNF